MKTRQKLNLKKKDNKILELRGNLFQVEPFYRLYLEFPFKTGTQSFTGDLYSGKEFNLIHTKTGKWYAVFYLIELNMYLLRKLRWLEHKPEIDIKTAYLYGKKHH